MAAKNLLVLGGTGWVGRYVAELAAGQDIEVTCLAWGTMAAAPAGARFVRADRTLPDACGELLDRDWDEVIDVTWLPGQARSAVAALGSRAAHWMYVSSSAVYLGAPIQGGTVTPLASDTASNSEYRAAKVACEAAVLDELGGPRRGCQGEPDRRP